MALTTALLYTFDYSENNARVKTRVGSGSYNDCGLLTATSFGFHSKDILSWLNAQGDLQAALNGLRVQFTTEGPSGVAFHVRAVFVKYAVDNGTPVYRRPVSDVAVSWSTPGSGEYIPSPAYLGLDDPTTEAEGAGFLNGPNDDGEYATTKQIGPSFEIGIEPLTLVATAPNTVIDTGPEEGSTVPTRTPTFTFHRA